MLVGYMRVSSDSDRQTTDPHRDALLSAGVDSRHLTNLAAGDTSVGSTPRRRGGTGSPRSLGRIRPAGTFGMRTGIGLHLEVERDSADPVAVSNPFGRQSEVNRYGREDDSDQSVPGRQDANDTNVRNKRSRGGLQGLIQERRRTIQRTKSPYVGFSHFLKGWWNYDSSRVHRAGRFCVAT